jgi:hypothetical protein
MPVISATNDENHGPGQLAQKARPYFKNNHKKKGLEVWLKYGVCASKCEALSSNSSTANNNNDSNVMMTMKK